MIVEVAFEFYVERERDEPPDCDVELSRKKCLQLYSGRFPGIQ